MAGGRLGYLLGWCWADRRYQGIRNGLETAPPQIFLNPTASCDDGNGGKRETGQARAHRLPSVPRGGRGEEGETYLGTEGPGSLGS